MCEEQLPLLKDARPCDEVAGKSKMTLRNDDELTPDLQLSAAVFWWVSHLPRMSWLLTAVETTWRIAFRHCCRGGLACGRSREMVPIAKSTFPTAQLVLPS